MGLFSKIGSTLSGLFGNRKRGSSDTPPPLPQSEPHPTFVTQRSRRAEREARALPGFYESYVKWAAWKTRQKLRGLLPKDAPIDVHTYQKELRDRKSESQPREQTQRGPAPRVGTRPSVGGKSDLERFLSGEWVDVSSSNVSRIAYDEGKATLRIIFHDENEYLYQPIHPKWAENFFLSGSKGGWVWDNLRIRGTALGHKVPYAHVAGHGDVQRKWIQTDERIVAHHSQVEEESTAYKGSKGDVTIGMVPGALIED